MTLSATRTVERPMSTNKIEEERRVCKQSDLARVAFQARSRHTVFFMHILDKLCLLHSGSTTFSMPVPCHDVQV